MPIINRGLDSEGLPQELKESLGAEYSQFLLDSQLERWQVVIRLNGNRLTALSKAPDGTESRMLLNHTAPHELRAFLDEEFRRWEERERPGRSWSRFRMGVLQVDIPGVFWLGLLIVFQIFSAGAGFHKVVNPVTALYDAALCVLYLLAIWRLVKAVTIRRTRA